MSAKKLDQSVFEGLPPEYRWAYLDRDGDPVVIGDFEAELDARFPDHRPDCYEDGLELTTWMDSVLWRKESIHDVARSIEAARVAEKSGNRCATCTANICSVIDDCYAQRAKEGSARVEEQACMPWPDGDARYFETSPVGQKHDASKPRYSLLPVGSVEHVIDVLEFGATKYTPDNWQHVSDARTRYYDATMRHLSVWWQGETHDAESGLHHLAHAACCILFLLWFDRGAK